LFFFKHREILGVNEYFMHGFLLSWRKYLLGVQCCCIKKGKAVAVPVCAGRPVDKGVWLLKK
jgi:hypothetical protein